MRRVVVGLFAVGMAFAAGHRLARGPSPAGTSGWATDRRGDRSPGWTRAAAVSVRSADEGRGLSGARVTLGPRRGARRAGRTNAGGRLELPLPLIHARLYGLDVAAAGFESAAWEVSGARLGRGPVELALVPSSRLVRAEVVLDHELGFSPAATATWEVVPSARRPWVALPRVACPVRLRRDPGTETRVRLVLPALPQGTPVRIGIRNPRPPRGWRPLGLDLGVVEVKAAARLPPLRLSGSGWSGCIRDPGAAPVTGAVVEIRLPISLLALFVDPPALAPESDGRFELTLMLAPPALARVRVQGFRRPRRFGLPIRLPPAGEPLEVFLP